MVIPSEYICIVRVKLLGKVLADAIVAQWVGIGRYELSERARFGSRKAINRKQRSIGINFFEILKDRGRLRDDGVSDAKSRHKPLRVYAAVFFRSHCRDRDVFVFQPLEMKSNPNPFACRVS